MSARRVKLPSILGAGAALCLTLCAMPLGADTLFFEDFSDNLAGWTLGPTWEIGPAQLSPVPPQGKPDPALDHTPTADNGIAGVVIGGFAPTNLHPFYWLTSPAIDIAVAGPVELEYYRWLSTDYPPYMTSRIEVFNGVTWSTLWSGPAGFVLADESWTPQSFDVTAYKSSTFQVRFGYSITSSGVYTVSSWNVDDVTLAVPGTTAVPEPASMTLLALGLMGLVARNRRRS